MHDINTMLASLRSERTPESLFGIDSAVLAGLAARKERDLARRSLVLAACIAGTLGLALGLDGGASASAEPLLGMPVSAPSHLLNG